MPSSSPLEQRTANTQLLLGGTAGNDGIPNSSNAGSGGSTASAHAHGQIDPVTGLPALRQGVPPIITGLALAQHHIQSTSGPNNSTTSHNEAGEGTNQGAVNAISCLMAAVSIRSAYGARDQTTFSMLGHVRTPTDNEELITPSDEQAEVEGALSDKQGEVEGAVRNGNGEE